MKKAISILLLLFLVGCDTVPLVQNLTQNQANEIVAVLSANGISAASTKDIGGSSNFSIYVSGHDYSASVQILKEERLPEEQGVTISSILTDGGIIPDSREIQALKQDKVLGLDIEKIISEMPGVLGASAVVRVKSVPKGSEPGVSVFVRVKSEADVNAQNLKEMVQASIRKMIPELKEGNLNVNFKEEEPRRYMIEGVQRSGDRLIRIPVVRYLFGMRVAEGSKKQLTVCILGLLFIVLILGFFVGYWIGYYRKFKDLNEKNFQ